MKTKEDNIIATKSYAFAVRCVNLYKYLCDVKNDYTIGRQLMRSRRKACWQIVKNS